ncbi:MAG: flagellin lysine-N-methylase [Candidatus Faecivicinus sp.]
MGTMREFTVPDYYAEFECKGGACRRTCCQGWPISLSMTEYFRLLGMDCSPELRRKLDGAFHLADSPSPERYAQISPNWRGDCPLHLKNGYCQLQCECGPEALSAICRMYPRSPRAAFRPECACSNSCERTLELLFARRDPLRFVTLPLDFDPPAPADVPEALKRGYLPVRRLCVDLLQDRARPLPVRLARLGAALRFLSDDFKSLDEARIAAALDALPPLPEADELPAPDERFALSFLSHINRSFGLSSASVGDYAQFACDRLGLGRGEPSEDALNRFRESKARFRALRPDWEILFEQALVNHVFYESFPFSDRLESLWDEFLSLSAVYAYFAFLTALWAAERPTDDELIAVASAAFRLIGHSAFDFNTAAILGARLRVTLAQAQGMILGAL